MSWSCYVQGIDEMKLARSDFVQYSLTFGISSFTDLAAKRRVSPAFLGLGASLSKRTPRAVGAAHSQSSVPLRNQSSAVELQMELGRRGQLKANTLNNRDSNRTRHSAVAGNLRV
jgi:hypothetical protein